MSTLVSVRGLAKLYPGTRPVRALDGVDLTIDTADSVAIVGSSGSGKTTLLTILGLLITPSGGTYLWRDRPVQAQRPRWMDLTRRYRIGFVFQDFQLIPYLDALDNVAVGLGHHDVSMRDRRRRSLDVLGWVGLGDRLAARPSELSGGEQQRVAIARALVKNPDLLLCDEPTGNLDSATSTQVLQLLQGARDRGAAVVVATHDPLVADWSERIVTLRDGKVVDDEAA